MSTEIRYPKITAEDEAGQLLQVKSYLHQLVGQLNWALKTLDGGGGTVAVSQGGKPVEAEKKTDSVASFNDIKALIIKSADIVNAYYDEINKRLEGLYVAQSDFGTFAEQTQQDIQANSSGIEQIFSNLQTIFSDIEGFQQYQIEVQAHIKSGLLFYNEEGIPVYGLEIGQRTEVNGEEVFDKYAQFTADKLAFFDSNGVEVAYISDRRLHILHVEVTGSFTLGGFVDEVRADRSVVTRWIGGSA